MKFLLSLYAIVLLALAPRLSLWLDEILTLIGATEPSIAALLDYIKTVPGGTLLAFLPPRWTIQLFGNSAFAGRFPSILASLAACWAMYRLARRLELRSPLLAVALFAMWPLQFRYALEARPYAIALALSLWSVEFFLAKRTAAYVAVTLLAALAQPYALFVTAAHLVWALLADRASLRSPIVAIVLSVLTLAPWYAHFRVDWSTVTAAPFDPRSPIVFLREISGSGYIGAVVLIAAVVLARPIPRDFLMVSIAVPLIGVFLANGVLHYFFATRQLIYILPPLVLLIGRARRWHVQAAFLLLCVYANVTWVLRPREDWQAAASVLMREAAQGACIQFQGDSTPVYAYFDATLGQHPCSPASARIALALTPYGGPNGSPPVGFTKRSENSFNGPHVEVYAK